MKARLTQVFSLALVLVMLVAMLASCGGDGDHTHTYADAWSKDNTNHWHAATCEHASEVKDKAAHTFAGGVCSVCGMADPGTGGSTDGGDSSTANWWDDVDFDGQTLTIQLSDDVADPELPAIKEYIQGPDKQSGSDTGVDKVKNAIYLRNNRVKGKKNGINVKLEYKYTQCTAADRWSQVRSVIVNAERNYASSDKADLYIDLMYDMVGAACEKGVFDNLLKYTKEDSGVSGWEGGYFELESYNGYNTALMEDMAMTADRQVLLASDYFLDVIRAMLLMPFNLSMYADLMPDDADAAGLYEIATSGQWTWDKLMSFKNVASNTGAATIDDEKLLMVVANGGMMASGILYSTSYQTYMEKATGGYTLKPTCSQVVELFAKAGELAKSQGVVVLSGESAAVTQANQKFTSGGALFATVNMLGILEENDFQEMGQGKLSVMPVPKLNDGADYSTLTNSRARVGALSYHSTNQKAMSAYIQLSTELSEETKSLYFNNAMGGKYLAGAGAGEVLNMIYNNLGNSKNAIIENLILARDWNIGKDNCWAQLIKKDGMTGNATNISSKYSSCISAKQTILDTAVAAWADAGTE